MSRPAVVGAALLIFLPGPATLAAQDSALPNAGVDSVTVHREGERAVSYTGRIEEITGESLILQRNNLSKTQVFRIADVTELTFVRPAEFDMGLVQRQKRNFSEAIRHFDVALENEFRDWARNEIQAAAARTCVTMGDRDAAVVRIEEILKNDPRSRHASLLPLVWDSRLLPRERPTSVAADLHHESNARKLVAASQLLQSQKYDRIATRTLQEIRNTALPRLAELAEAQLWRVELAATPDDAIRRLPTWQRQLGDLPLNARGGPQFVIGQRLERQHRYDEASIAFLWLPLMSPWDEAISALSMREAMRCLTASGRLPEAAAIRKELLTRFPKTSAAIDLP